MPSNVTRRRRLPRPEEELNDPSFFSRLMDAVRRRVNNRMVWPSIGGNAGAAVANYLLDKYGDDDYSDFPGGGEGDMYDPDIYDWDEAERHDPLSMIQALLAQEVPDNEWQEVPVPPKREEWWLREPPITPDYEQRARQGHGLDNLYPEDYQDWALPGEIPPVPLQERFNRPITAEGEETPPGWTELGPLPRDYVRNPLNPHPADTPEGWTDAIDPAPLFPNPAEMYPPYWPEEGRQVGKWWITPEQRRAAWEEKIGEGVARRGGEDRWSGFPHLRRSTGYDLGPRPVFEPPMRGPELNIEALPGEEFPWWNAHKRIVEGMNLWGHEGPADWVFDPEQGGGGLTEETKPFPEMEPGDMAPYNFEPADVPRMLQEAGWEVSQPWYTQLNELNPVHWLDEALSGGAELPEMDVTRDIGGPFSLLTLLTRLAPYAL